MKWDPPSEKLRIRIGTAFGLMSPHGTLRRSFFAKTSVLVGGGEIRQLKSVAKQATPDVHLNVEYAVDMKPNEISESSILIQLYGKLRERLSLTSELIGSTIIGPYMQKDFNSFTHWENMIANPMEETMEIHDLHL